MSALGERPTFAPGGGRGDGDRRQRPPPRSRARAETGRAWFDDPVALAVSPDIDIFVELIGGAEGPARAAVEAALDAGKPVVTANKALIAEHGAELAAPGRGAGRAAAVRGGGDGRRAGGEDAARGRGRRRGPDRRRHPQRHLQLHPDRDGGDRPLLRRGARRGPGAWATPRPTRPPTSAASTPRTRSPSWPPWPSACAPDSRRGRDRGIDQIELLDIRLAKALGYRIKLVASAAPDRRRRLGARRSGAGAARPSPGRGRRGAERAVHREPPHRPHLRAGARARAAAPPPPPWPPTSPTS